MSGRPKHAEPDPAKDFDEEYQGFEAAMVIARIKANGIPCSPRLPEPGRL